MRNNDFNFFIPLSEDALEKSSKVTGEDRYKNMIVEGLASDDSEDTDEEVLEPNGYILDRFLKYGKINYEHLAKSDPSMWIGEPIAASVKDNKFYVKGKLWDKHPIARKFWDTALIMKASGSTRRPGWSIEGKKLMVDPFNKKRIRKALITNIALTFSPKNANSYADIVKGGYEKSFIDIEEEKEDCLLEIKKGDQIVRINKDFTVEKAMAAGSETGTDLTDKDTSGASLKKESLKKKLINLQPNIIASIKTISKHKDKLTKEQLDEVKNIIKSFLV